MTEQQVIDRIEAAHLSTSQGSGDIPRSCITASRLLVELLKGQSEEVSVQLLVLTAAGAKASQHINDFDQLLAWLREHPEHGAGIGVGEAGPDEWAGHLAVMIHGVRPGHILFADLTAARTLGHLIPKPVPVRIFLDQATYERGEFESMVGELKVVYRVADNDEYKKAPNWRNTGRISKVVRDIQKFLKQKERGRRVGSAKT